MISPCRHPLDLLIVGGGPAGSLLALLGARAGLRVRLLDASTFPRPKPCGGVLSPRAVAILQECLLLPRVLDAGAQPIRAIEVVSGGGVRLRLPYGAGLALARERLDICLLDAAAGAGAEVWTGTRAEQVEPGAGGAGARVHFRTPGGSLEVCEAAWVAGAGGGRCPVRRGLGGSVSRRRRPATGSFRSAAREAIAVTALLEGEAVPHGVCEMHLLGDGYCGVAAGGGGLTTVGLVLPARTFRGLRESAASPTEALRAALASRATLAGLLSRLPVCAGPWLSGSLRTDPPRNLPAGVTLIGDALARMEPITGEGMAEALASARRAARWLTRHPDPRRASRLHRAQRRSLQGARRRSALAAALGRAPAAAGPLARWVRRAPWLAQSAGRAIAAGRAEEARG